MNPRLEKKLAELKTKFAREEVFRELAQANLVREANFIEDLTPADYLWEMVSDASTPADFTLSHDAPRNAIDAWLNKVQTHFRALETVWLYPCAPVDGWLEASVDPRTPWLCQLWHAWTCNTFLVYDPQRDIAAAIWENHDGFNSRLVMRTSGLRPPMELIDGGVLDTE